MDTLKEEELKEIESQLSFPNGDAGIEMAKMMNETNIQMTLESIKALNIKDNDHLSELGHGNGLHINDILNQAENVSFSGLEISETMYNEAKNLNRKFTETKQATFLLYNGEQIPLPNASIDKIMTVNTLYFWKNPLQLFEELYRVLKPNGRLVITFAKAEFMKKLPFVQSKFNLFTNAKAKQLVEQTAFTFIDILDKNDIVKSKQGDIVSRDFSVLILEKK